MKKILALVLAVLMMATVAFAAPDTTPGSTLKFRLDTANGTLAATPAAPTTIAAAATVPFNGKKLEFTSKNYAITNVKWTAGKDLVESVKFNDADEVVEIKLKQDYTNTKDTKNITGTMRIGQKGTSSYSTVTVAKTTVYYEKAPLVLTADHTVTGGTINNASIEKKIVEFTTGDYATMELSSAGNTAVTAKVYKNDKFYLYSNADANTAVLKAAPEDATLNFVNFPGKPTLNSTATIYFYDADTDKFVYEIKDGKYNVAGKYSEDDGCWVVKTRTLGNYVVSDKKLVAAADTKPANPDTGANDVVGIATALAAVALVSAAAVSLKK